MKAFVEFCYKGDYGLPEDNKTAQLDVEVYVLADYLLSPDLKEAAAEKLKTHISPAPLGMLDASEFKKFWEEDMAELVDSVYSVTTAADTYQDLRTAVVDTVMHGLLIEVLPWESLQEPIKIHHDFTAVVFTRHADGVRKGLGIAKDPRTRTIDCTMCKLKITMTRPAVMQDYSWNYHNHIKCPYPACSQRLELGSSKYVELFPDFA